MKRYILKYLSTAVLLIIVGGISLFVPSHALAAFPSVTSVTNSGSNPSQSSLSVSVPAVSTGDRLLAFFIMAGGQGGGAAPSGWTRIYDDNQYVSVYEKIASTNENAGNVTFTQDTSSGWAAQVYLISGSHPSEASQLSSVTSVSNGSSIDPPSFSPTGGAKDWLWIAIDLHGHLFGTTRTISSYPTNYTSTTPSNQTGGISQQLAGSAYRQLNTATENPGAFTLSGAIQTGRGFTIVVPPPSSPTITTPTNTNITSSGATLGGNVTLDGGSTITGRGVCVGTSADPALGGTCFSTSGTTGVFTVAATGLTQNTLYHYRAYATNAIGTSYTTDDTFTTATNAPNSVTADAETNVGSYKVTLNGSANPNNLATTMYFRVFSADPGTCPADGGSGLRAPSNTGSDLDLTLTTNGITQQKTYTTRFGAPSWLTPSTNYWYCTYAINSAGTTVSTTPQAFTTTSGAENPCDPATTGDLTITESCNFADDNDGVDSGTGSTNTAILTVGSGANLTVNSNQKVARGSLVRGSGASISLAAGASVLRGGVWVKDADGDGSIDDATRTVSSTQPAGYVRRKDFSGTYPYYSLLRAVNTFDCDSTNANIYQNVASLVTDSDNDGYKTSAAASAQCVGPVSVINTRTYYKDSTGAYTRLASGSVLGGGSTDCYDNSAAPCPPNTPTTGSNTTSSLALSWTGSTGPSATSYNLRWCQNASCSPSTTISDVSSGYSHTGRTCGTLYRYDVIANNSSGSSSSSSVGEGSTSSCGGGGTWVDRLSAAGASGVAILGVAIGPNNEMIAVGGNGYVRTSTDGGANWTNRNTAAGAGTTNLEFAAIGPDGTMIIVGWNGFIATSTNGGVNWTNRTTAAGSGTLQLRGAAIGPDGTIIVVGDSGYIRTSTNGGANWTNRNTAAGAGTTILSGVAFDASGTLIAVGQNGYIRTSTNGGANWTDRNTAAGAGVTTLIEASAGPSGYLVAAGNSGYIRTSTDGGANWTNRNTAAGAGTTALYGVSMNSDGSIIIAVGSGGYIRTSNDGGVNWTNRNSAAGAGTTLIYGSGIGPDNEMFAGGNAYIRTSTE